jgi:hypothetical protein
MAVERTIRYILKVLQLVFSIYLVCALFLTGPHWILIAACIAVPIFGKLKCNKKWKKFATTWGCKVLVTKRNLL